MRRSTFALVAFLLVATPAQADFDDGVEAYRGGDYKTAFEEFKPLADEGHADAQYFLGVMYGVGLRVPQDNGEAVKWYQKAAEQGHVKAQNNLGVMYENGQGVPQDYAEALKWHQKAAEQGLAQAQYNLALMYANGQGVPQDYILSYMWFTLAASEIRVGEDALTNLAIIDQLMTSDQIDEAQRLAHNWKPKESGGDE